MLKTKDEILKISPYVPGKSGEKGQKVMKLSSNENALGCSESVYAVLADFKDVSRYPNPTASHLRAKLGELNGLDADKIICGCGSDEILELLAYAYAGEGDEVVYTQHGFLVYPIAAMSAGATPVAVPEKNFTTDVDALLAAVNEKTKIVMVANPNNPTGTYINGSEMQRLRDGLREDILLVIDNAYAECVTADDYDMGYGIADSAPNTIVTRTFSKAYGLANMRVGWGYAAPEIIDILNRIRPPFNLTGPSQLAAIAALEDQEFLNKSVEHNTKWREWLTAELRNLGRPVVDSQANFILAHFEDASAANEALREAGIIVREVGNYGLPDYLRISIGTEEEMKAVVSTLREFLAN